MGTRTEDADLASRFDAEVRLYVELRDVADDAEAAAKRVRQQADEQRDRLFDLLESAGVKTITHDLGRITRTVRTKALVQDPDILSQWLENEGLQQAFTKTVFRQANLNELAKEQIENGAELPPGLDSLAIRSITFTRAK